MADKTALVISAHSAEFVWRRKEAENAARALKMHDLQFFDVRDYPPDLGRDTQNRTAILRTARKLFAGVVFG